MDKNQINSIVINVIREYCDTNGVVINELDKDTPLIGSARILDSMGLVNIVVDIETAFLDEDIEISLTSETAMSGRISPFRTIANWAWKNNESSYNYYWNSKGNWSFPCREVSK